MEDLLKDFDIPAKNPSEVAIRRWRSAVTVIRNRRRRFRMVADLNKLSQLKDETLKTQEVKRAVQQATLDLIDARKRYKPSEVVKKAGFEIDPDRLSSLVLSNNNYDLDSFFGVEGIARFLNVSLDKGISTIERPPLYIRQEVFGSNTYDRQPHKSFWTFIWDTLHDITLIILVVCAVVCILLGVAIDGWTEGVYDGLGIILCVLLVVMITAITDFKQNLQFQDLNEQKRKTFILVSRDGSKQRLSVYDLVVGDVVHLITGDIVPADGIYISGFNLVVDQSSLTGESETVNVNKDSPFLLSGTKVQDGSGKMLVAAVGMRTHWGRVMQSISQGGENETPLQVKLNGVATIMGKIALTFSLLTFLVLAARLVVGKALQNGFLEWSRSDVLNLLNYVAIAVTILVVGIPEGVPMAVMSALYCIITWLNILNLAIMRRQMYLFS